MHKHMSDYILKTLDTTDLLFIQLIKILFHFHFIGCVLI